MGCPFYKKEIINVVYANEKHDLILVEYNANPPVLPEKLVRYYVPVLEQDNEDLKVLQKLGYDFEYIYEETVKFNRSQSESFKNLYRKFAEKEMKEMEERHQKEIDELTNGIQDNGRSLVNAMIRLNENENALLDAKLAVFELPELKDIHKDEKTKIRQAKTITELFTHVFEHLPK